MCCYYASTYIVAFIRFAGGRIWLPQESLRHILASPGYAPGTIAVNFTWMKRGFNDGQTLATYTHLSSTISVCLSVCLLFVSMGTLPEIKTDDDDDMASYWSKIATFSYPTSV